jgi:hypothetical protein
MKKLLVALLTITGLLFSEGTSEEKKKNNYFKDNFLKYSTFYFSVGLDSPFAPAHTFKVDNDAGTFEETTREVEASYNLTIGVRKLARFKYQVKKNNFYDGSENELSEKALIGAVSGWEYQAKYSAIRAFGQEFINTESWIRYLGDQYVVKAAYVNFGREDLEFGQLDARYRKSIGSNWNFTAGASFRAHPAYGQDPFSDWVQSVCNACWPELAYYYGYTNEEYDLPDNDHDYIWYGPDGNIVADTDEEFYEYVYGDLIHQYNESVVNALGYQWESSLAIGVDYYLYEKKYWVHGWATIIPYSYGLTDHSFQYEKGDIDLDLGLIAGIKFNKHIGLFGEGRYLSYFGIDSYTVKAGLNYTFF